MIGGDQVGALVFGHERDEFAPAVGPEGPGTAAVEPVKLCLRGQEYAAQHQMDGAVGMRFAVDERQRRAPAAAKDDPAVDAKRRAYPFDIRDEVPGSVRRHAGMGAGAAAAALIEKDDPVMRRVEIAPHRGGTAAARPAMQNHDRHAMRLAALFDIDVMPVAHIQHPLIEGFDLRIKKLACAFLPCDPIHGLTI